MRQGLNIKDDLDSLLPQFVDTTAGPGWQIGMIVLESRQSENQQDQTLNDVVVKLSGDTGTFLLLRLDQSAAYAG
jgi:hypothetical protein